MMGPIVPHSLIKTGYGNPPIIPTRAEGSDYNVDIDNDDDGFRAKQLLKKSKKPASTKKISFMQFSHPSKFMTVCVLIQLLVCK